MVCVLEQDADSMAIKMWSKKYTTTLKPFNVISLMQKKA